MCPAHPVRGSTPSGCGSAPVTGADSIDPLAAVRLLERASGALIAQLALHVQLARVEWAQEKRRLSRMLVVMLLGSACVLCVMLLVCVLALALSWDTAYRVPCVVALIAVYGLGVELARRRFLVLLAQGASSFAATREEIDADITLLRSML